MGSERGDHDELATTPPTVDSLEHKVFAARLEARLVGGEPDLPRVDRFVLERMLGAGGMGTVWLARDEKLGRRVALKLVRGGGAAAGERMRLREARGLARITHPNVIVVHDVGEHDGRVWLAMEYVPGRTLRACAGELARDEALAHWIAAGRGLAAIHAAGLVHRDVKPDNVLLGDDGRVRIIDLGLVREADASDPARLADTLARSQAVVQTAGFVGTRAYAAPEQLRGEPVDARADQYAYAVALLESLRAAKRPPGHEHEPVPAMIREILARACQVDPAQRFPDMRELCDALAGAAALERTRPSGADDVGMTTRESPLRLIGDGIATDPTLLGTPSSSGARPEPPVVMRIGHYEVLAELGRGGMGVVYVAHDPRLDRKVAVKRLLGGRGEQPRRLYREALAMAKLSHPNVIPIYEIVEDGDATSIVMEYVEGQTLREWQAIPRTRDEVLAVYKAAARGLIAAHQKHLVHRDFKPDNVMLGDDGRVRVMDFGLASVGSQTHDHGEDVGPTGEGAALDLTGPGTLMGTPAYMSPEQMLGAPVGPASDVFSFCVALHEALHGERPFPGRSLPELIDAVTRGALREPPADSRVPGWLHALLRRGLAVEPADRFESMQALLDAIVAGELAEHAAQGEPPAYVFVAHDSRDKREVLRLCERLIDHGVRPWLDLWELTPGVDPRTAAEQALLAAPAVIVCGTGMHAGALAARVERDPATVVGVRLPGAAVPEVAGRPVVTLDEDRWEDGVLELARRIGVDPTRERWLADEAARAGVPMDALSPYRGLEAFREQDARWMFGRDDEVAALLDLIRAGQTRFLTLIGASGSGKSSLLLAGVCPMLRCGALGDRVGWRIASLRPGPRPCEALAHALVHLESGGADAARISRLRAELLADRDTLRLFLGRRDPGASAPGRTLLVIDQFEELFTEAGLGGQDDGSEALAFVRNLLEATRELAALDGNLWIAATLRADFVQRALAVPELARALQVGTYFALPPMGEAQLRTAIERPAARVGYRVDSRVLDRLVAGAAHQAGRLPLLQHVLRELWTRRDPTHRTLNEAAYAETGGLEGAIAVAAERALDGLRTRLGPDGELATRRLMTRLVHLGDRSSEDTRRRVSLAALGDDATTRHVLEALVRDARVLVTTEVDGAVTVEIAHEALLREWTTLVRWLDADRGALKLRQELAQDAARGTSSEYLWGRSRVEEARRVLGASTVELDATERGLLVASERAVNRRRRWLQAGVATALATAAIVVAVVSAQRAEAVQERDRADEQTRLANTHAADAALQKTAAETARDRARDAAWISYARMLHEKDPTRALAGLQNVKAKDSAGWLDEALYTLNEPIALVSVPGIGATVSPDGTRVLALSWDSTANYVVVWNIDGSGEPVILRGHENYLTAARFSPDGRRIVTASGDHTVHIWNADGSGEPVVLRGHTDAVNTLSISPDGRQLLTSSSDGTARVWSMTGSGESIAFNNYFERNSPLPLFEPSFSPDGRRILVRTSEKTASIHNADGSGKPVVLKGHQGIIIAARFSPDGRRVATASDDRTVRVWGPGETIVLRGHQELVWGVEFSPDGGRIVTRSVDRTARVWTVDGRGDPVVLRHESWINSASFSPDGRRIATSADNKAYLWDARGSGRPVVFSGHDAHVHSAHFILDGRYIVTSSDDGTSRVWRADNRRSILDGGVWERAKFSPDGLRIVVASPATARVWNADGSGEPVILDCPEVYPISHVDFSPDGKRLVFASRTTIQVQNADGSGEPMAVASDEPPFWSMQPSPDGRRIVAASGDVARVWDLDGMRAPVVLRGHEKTVRSAEFSPDSQRVVTSSVDCTVRVWNADGSDQPEIFTNSTHESSCGDYGVVGATFSPDGRRIAAWALDAVWVWNAGSPGAPRILAGAWEPQVLEFSPDGRRILASAWNVGLIWDLEGSDEPVKLVGHAGAIRTTTFSSDGRLVLTSGEDGTARVWNLDGSAAVVLRGHTGSVWSAYFSPNGQRVVTSGSDRTARVWDLDLAVVQARVAAATTLCVPYRDRVQFVGEQPQEACAAFLACEREHGRQSSCE